MTDQESRRPWDELDRLVDEQDPERLRAYLDSLPPGEATRALSRLTEDDQERLLTVLPPEDAADLLEAAPDEQAPAMIDDLPRETAAAILDELSSDDQADLIGALDRDDAEDILAEMDPVAAQRARRLARYPARSAGGLMATELLSYDEDRTAADVLADLRQRADELGDQAVQYVYVTGAEGRLAGVLRLRELVFSPGARKVGALAERELVTLPPTARLNEMAAIFDERAFLGVPVVDDRGRLIGVVHRAAVEEALGERAGSDYLKSLGIVGGEEFRTMALRSRSTRRLSWLTINIVLNLIAASVIAFYQDTLSAVISLAVFLPIISDMSGCSGNQAVAVSMRELSLGLVKPYEALWVWLKEIQVGLINGLVLGALIAAVAWFWQGNPMLGLVVGGAMAVNTMIAVSIGGTVPLVLKRFRMDPALASGPILTTITDLCGFLLILSFATAMLPWLVAR